MIYIAYICIYIYIYIYIIMSCYQHGYSNPLSTHLPIVHCFRQILRATSRIGTDLLYVGSNWTSCFARPREEVHRSTSLTSSSQILQQCPACLVRLILIVFVMGGSCCFVDCCLQDLFNIARSILV